MPIRLSRLLLLVFLTLASGFHLPAQPVPAGGAGVPPTAPPTAPPVTPLLPYRWASVAMGGAGFVSGIIAHPAEKNLIYARTDVGGAYRFHAATGSWLPLLDWLPPENASAMGVESLALDPRDPAKVYLLAGTPYWRGGTSILRSADRGQTWHRIDVSSIMRAHGNKWGRHTGERLAVDPNLGRILFCGSRDSGLWKSGDSGATWSPVKSFASGPPILRQNARKPEHPAATTNGNGICFVVFDPATGTPGQPTQGIFAGLSRPRQESYSDASGSSTPLPDGNLFHSPDGGATWNVLPPLPDVGPPEARANTAFHPNRALVAGGKLLVTFQAEKEWGGGIFRYDPASGSWEDITPGEIRRDGENNGQFARIYDRYGGIDLVGTAPARLLASTFGNYQPQSDVTGKRLWGERIYLSPRGAAEDGKSWVNLFGGGKARLEHVIPFSKGQNIHWGGSVALDPFTPDRAFISSGNGIWGTPNLLAALSPEEGKFSVWKMAVQGLEESVPMDVASIPGGPLVSVIWDYAGFLNWDPAEYGPGGKFRVCGGLNVRLATVGSGRQAGVLRLNSGGQLCWSADSGQTWKALEDTRLGKAGTQAAIALSADATTILYLPADRKVYRNSDPARQWPAAGWTEVTDLAGGLVPVADPVDPKRFYAYQGRTGKLLASNDGGSTFQAVADIGRGGNGVFRAAPGKKEDLWIPMNQGGIARYHEGKITRLPVHLCRTLGHGRGLSPGDYPAIFIYGKVLADDPEAIYRSTDQGATWGRVNDDRHRYGDLANGGFVKGCMNVFGRVYRSTAGRGVAFGTPGPGG